MISRRAVPLFIGALLVMGLLCWVGTLVFLWHSYYGMFPATGTIAALAEAALRGQAPGHDDGRVFLAGYYFPPLPMMVAVAHRAGLGWLQALRASSLASGLLMLVAAGWAAWALGAKRRGALLAPALVLATYTFKVTGMDARADLLAAAFSLAALAAWSRDEDARGWAVPALAAASFLTKATSITLPLALLFWTLRYRRGAGLLGFTARFAACVLAESLLTLPVHGPAWYVNALNALVTAPLERSALMRGPTELVRYVGVCGELAVFTILALVLLAGRRMRGKPVVAYCGVSFFLTTYVMTKYGAAVNQLDELSFAAATCAAVWAAHRLGRRALLPGVALTIAVLGASWRDVGPVLHYGRDAGNLRAQVIDAVRRESGEVLTEDPLLSLAAGRRPAISDGVALRSMALKRDPRALKIVDGLSLQRFTLVVLNDDVEEFARWYRIIHYDDLMLGPIQAHYVKVGVLDNYHLYRPAKN